jgi:Cys-tRNA synthase (O-phospho-L-seryl-tRNA:Cys-tRNA synthase)
MTREGIGMELVCPLCNGIVDFNIKCPICDKSMINEGPVVDYLDEYSPYLASDITQLVDGAPYDKCVHLFQCKHCNYDDRVQIDRVRM